MTIVIMNKEAKDVPIKPKEIEFDKDGRAAKYVDSKGKTVKKIQVQGSEYKWVYEDGTVYTEKAYKSINGKPVKEFSKTTLIDKYDILDKAEEKYFIQNEHTYLLIGSELKEKLKELEAEGKICAFKYVIRGFKIYKAVAYYDKELDKALMRCYRGDIRKANLDETESVKEIESADDVDSIDLDSLEL